MGPRGEVHQRQQYLQTNCARGLFGRYFHLSSRLASCRVRVKQSGARSQHEQTGLREVPGMSSLGEGVQIQSSCERHFVSAFEEVFLKRGCDPNSCVRLPARRGASCISIDLALVPQKREQTVKMRRLFCKVCLQQSTTKLPSIVEDVFEAPRFRWGRHRSRFLNLSMSFT